MGQRKFLTGLCIAGLMILWHAVLSHVQDTSRDMAMAAATMDYREEMRRLVEAISVYTKGMQPNFMIIPQNGHDLVTENGEADGSPVSSYLRAIDGIGREDLLYGYEEDDVATPPVVTEEITGFLDLAERNNVQVLVTDYCSTPAHMDESYRRNTASGYISFAADHRELDHVPSYPASPYQENPQPIQRLTEAKNFLYLLNQDPFENRPTYFSALRSHEYDVLLIDAFFQGDILTAQEVAALQQKSNGNRRLVVAYMSIGEAEDYRYYWQEAWTKNPPRWLEAENPQWAGNFKVRYWDPVWQAILFGNDGSYLKRILDAGFDGVYLDIIDAFEYFEEQSGIPNWGWYGGENGNPILRPRYPAGS